MIKHLVLLHGWGAAGHIWQRQVEAFGQNFTVLAPRIPFWEAGWLTAYLGRVDLEESALVGWSLGGMLLLEALAGRAGPAPRATVLVGTAPVFCRQPDHPWGQPAAAVRAMRRALGSEPRRVINDFARACLAPGEEAFSQEAAAGFDLAATPAYLAQGLDYLRDTDLRGLLPRIRGGRVVIVQGSRDQIVPAAQAQFLHEQLPGSVLHLLAGAGHLPFLTQADVLNRILQELITAGARKSLPQPKI